MNKSHCITINIEEMVFPFPNISEDTMSSMVKFMTEHTVNPMREIPKVLMPFVKFNFIKYYDLFHSQSLGLNAFQMWWLLSSSPNL